MQNGIDEEIDAGTYLGFILYFQQVTTICLTQGAYPFIFVLNAPEKLNTISGRAPRLRREKGESMSREEYARAAGRSLIAIDHGFSATKAIYNGMAQKFPSAIARVRETGVGFDMKGVYNYRGSIFRVGHDALPHDNKTYMRDVSFFLEFAPLLVAHTLELYKCEQAPTKLVVGLPVAEHSKFRDPLAAALSRFSINGVEFEFDVTVLSQGASAMGDFVSAVRPPLDECGYLVDLGFNTVISIRYESLQPQRDGSRQYDQWGISRALEEVKDKLKRDYRVDIDLVALNDALLHGRIRGKRYLDLPAIAQPILEKYFNELIWKMRDDFGRYFDRSERLVLCGGGVHFINHSHFPIEYHDKIHILDQPEFCNVRGYYMSGK